MAPDSPWESRLRQPTVRWQPNVVEHPLHHWHDPYSRQGEPYWGSSNLPVEDVIDSPGLVHAWEMHHVLSWLHTVGLGDIIATFRAKKFKGEDLLKLTPKNAAEALKLADETTVMRVLEQVMPLKDEWKAARQAAGLMTMATFNPPAPDRVNRLVAELHVMIQGMSSLPPGASGAYVILELGDFVARSTFVGHSAPEAWYYEDRRRAMLAYGEAPYPPTNSGFIHRPSDTYAMWPTEEGPAPAGSWPQTFRLTIDEKIAKDKDKKYGEIFLDLVAWFPHSGELSLGRLEVPVPKKKDTSCRMRFETPLNVEMHWKAYGKVAKPDEEAWEKEADSEVLPPQMPNIYPQAWSPWWG